MAGTLRRHNPELERRVRAHVGTCSECSAALAMPAGPPSRPAVPRYGRGSSTVQPFSLEPTLATMAILTGQLWNGPDLPPTEDYFYGPPVPLLLIVDAGSKASGDLAEVQVAPVTDRDELASEWSLVIDEAHTGLRETAIVHLDRIMSVRSSNLQRLVTRLSDIAFQDVQRGLDAYWISVGMQNESPTVTEAEAKLQVSSLGSFDVRVRSDWLEQSELLDVYAAQIGLELLDEIVIDEGWEPVSPPISDNLESTPVRHESVVEGSFVTPEAELKGLRESVRVDGLDPDRVVADVARRTREALPQSKTPSVQVPQPSVLEWLHLVREGQDNQLRLAASSELRTGWPIQFVIHPIGSSTEIRLSMTAVLFDILVEYTHPANGPDILLSLSKLRRAILVRPSEKVTLGRLDEFDLDLDASSQRIVEALRDAGLAQPRVTDS